MELKPGFLVLCQVPAGAFNRTTMELKPIKTYNYILYSISFNRTTMELKRIIGIQNVLHLFTFNRTTMELKQEENAKE